MTRELERALKIGLLGIDASIARVIDAARRAGDAVAMACDVPLDSPHAAAIGADVPRAPSWQALVDSREFDVVCVGADGWNPDRAEGVRGLVQAGHLLVLGQPLELSMLWAYELEMIRVDSGARIVPCLADRMHPFVSRLRAVIEAGLGGGHPLGAVETIALERRSADRSRDAVLRALSRDADLIRVLAGDPQRLSALGGPGEAAWATLHVGFTGGQQVPVHWRITGAAPPGLRVTLSCARGTTTVVIPDDDSTAWEWRDEPPVSDDVERLAFDRGAAVLAAVHRLAGDTSGPPPTGGVPPATWADAARAIELAETVPRSLTKGRAIDLHQEEFSEIGTFKGTMASLGCGIVLAALAVVVLAALVGGVAREAGWEAGERLAGVWPYLVLTALMAFLALQVLPLLITGGRRE